MKEPVESMGAPVNCPRQNWQADLVARARWHFPSKVIATSALIALFFVGYFYVQEHPAYPVTVMPLTALDHMIPFQPGALWAYLTLWVYVGVGPGLQRTSRELLIYAIWIGGLCAAGLGLLYFWPTQLPPLRMESTGFMAVLQRIDAASNACPSMHVAAATFTAIRVHELLSRMQTPIWLRSVNWAWCVLIAYSTLAIKQHVVLDLVAGALLGAAFALASLPARARAHEPARERLGRG